MNLYMQACSLLIIGVLLFFDMRLKKVGLMNEKIYVGILSVNALSIILDVAVTVILVYAKPEGYVWLVLVKAYYVLLLFVAMLPFAYIMSDLGRKQGLNFIIISSAIAIAEAVAVILLPLNLIPGEKHGTVVGTAKTVTYVSALLFVLLVILTIYSHRKKIAQRRRAAVVSWMVTLVLADVIQIFVPDLRVLCFGCAIGMMILYFTLENPESNIDKYFGCFNSLLLESYVHEMRRNNKEFSAIYLTMAEASKTEDSEAELNDHLRTIIDFLNNKRQVKIFKNIEQEFVAFFPDDIIMNRVYHDMINRFYYDQFAIIGNEEEIGKQSSFPASLFVLVPDSGVIESTAGFFKVLQDLREKNKDNIISKSITLSKTHFEALREKEKMVDEITAALAEDRVEVFYQPIYSTKEKRFVSSEALARIRMQDGSILPPGKFIPVAEETGLISELGERVFEKTCKFINSGLPTRYGVKYIEVNLSVVQCEQTDLAAKYIEIMERYQVDPSMINLEITETASIRTKKKLQQNMEKLIEYGVDFSLDDFGNGHSNLDYIIDMPIDIVKLDMSLIQAYEKEKKARAVVQAAVRMICDMDLRALTEGVETRDQLVEMENIGVNYVQGYYFSKPVPEAEYIEYLKLHHGVG